MKIRVLDIWIIDIKQLGKIPESLQGLISENECQALIAEIYSKDDFSKLFSYRNDLLEKETKKHEIKIMQDSLKWNKILVVATIAMAIVSSWLIWQQLNIEAERQRMENNLARPFLVFSSSGCNDFLLFNSQMQTEFSGPFFVLDNYGKIPLPYEVEINSDFLQFLIENPVICESKCCHEYLNECIYSAPEGQSMIIMQDKELAFKYRIRIPPTSRPVENFSYSITIHNLDSGKKTVIQKCEYRYVAENSTYVAN